MWGLVPEVSGEYSCWHGDGSEWTTMEVHWHQVSAATYRPFSRNQLSRLGNLLGTVCGVTLFLNLCPLTSSSSFLIPKLYLQLWTNIFLSCLLMDFFLRFLWFHGLVLRPTWASTYCDHRTPSGVMDTHRVAIGRPACDQHVTSVWPSCGHRTRVGRWHFLRRFILNFPFKKIS